MNISTIKLKYNEPLEVSEKAFNTIMNGDLSGTCAGKKTEDGKYVILPWLMRYRNYIKQAIATYPL